MIHSTILGQTRQQGTTLKSKDRHCTRCFVSQCSHRSLHSLQCSQVPCIWKKIIGMQSCFTIFASSMHLEKKFCSHRFRNLYNSKMIADPHDLTLSPDMGHTTHVQSNSGSATKTSQRQLHLYQKCWRRPVGLVMRLKTSKVSLSSMLGDSAFFIAMTSSSDSHAQVFARSKSFD